MDTDKFFNEFNRMCKSYKSSSCSGCSLLGLCNSKLTLSNLQYFIPIVEKWSKDHQAKTRREDFFEKYPDAQTKSSGVPEVCARELGYKNATCSNCKDCKDCWSKQLEE